MLAFGWGHLMLAHRKLQPEFVAVCDMTVQMFNLSGEWVVFHRSWPHGHVLGGGPDKGHR